MQILSLRQLATRSALLLSLGLGSAACDKAINVEPSNSISSDTGFTTKEDAAAGLLGVYDALQLTDYYGVGFPTISDLISGDVAHVGTFTTTLGLIAQNQAQPDNVQIQNTWDAIYATINRANYLIQESEKITDPAFPKLTTQAQARAIRALSYMNLVGLWGGSPQGYGYSGGLGVPLRLVPTVAIGESTAPIARASEAEVAAAIRADLDFAIENLATGVGNRVTKNAALALRARFELRMRNYADALKFASQVPASAGFATAALTATTTPDAIWQLTYSATDTNLYAFWWYTTGGRNELNPGVNIAAAHPAGDKRLAVNVVTGGLTQKYTRTTTRDDPFNVIRYAEVVLTIAEASAQTGNLVNAAAQLNIIRSRAGLAPTTATTADALVRDILLQRRLELAYEGNYWFDLRRTNMVQTALPTYNQTFRNLFPLPNREIQLANGVLTQNPSY
ncbi:RagB/SusD family nutrient uptake outer membrane protein [Hymenobacter mucosus]|uniref:Starch-binding associating with outer membrane n=1 Tax=Hymenobacter mucosus TaxID=1411120 RepID=A0A238W470_9BACT|nr:RagB/SusD family nutrient uptake outer membrane protein [Hymenobacter mucosus]SNR40963.1 Starch-binding associating with outer membrane [Hymenobacter mucosus]